MDYTELYRALNEIQLDNNQVLKCIMAVLYFIFLIKLCYFINDIIDLIISVIRKITEKIKEKKGKVKNNG